MFFSKFKIYSKGDFVFCFSVIDGMYVDACDSSIAESVKEIVEGIKMTLERTPPELSADIMDKGIMLAGGGGLIKGLDMLVSQETGMPVYIAENSLDCVVNGAKKVLEDIDKLQNVLANTKQIRR